MGTGLFLRLALGSLPAVGATRVSVEVMTQTVQRTTVLIYPKTIHVTQVMLEEESE